MTDRNTINVFALTAAVNALHAAENRDEADIAFEQVLLTQGVISPADTIECIVVSEAYGAVAVALDTGKSFTVWANGEVT